MAFTASDIRLLLTFLFAFLVRTTQSTFFRKVRLSASKSYVETTYPSIEIKNVNSIAVQTFLNATSNSFNNKDILSLVLQTYQTNFSYQSQLVAFEHSSTTKMPLNQLKSIHGRLVTIKGKIMFQLNYRYRTNDQAKNYELYQTTNEILSELLGYTDIFQKAILITATDTFELKLSSNKRNEVIKVTPTILRNNDIVNNANDNKNSTNDSIYNHNRQKNTFVPSTSSFLRALKVTVDDDSGRPKTGMADKLRQIQKFVEIMDSLLSSQMNENNQIITDKILSKQQLRIVDMGCGMGYLTFAIHSHFSKILPSIETIGIEIREQLVDQTNRIAESLGPEFSKLKFQKGDISSVYTDPQLNRSANDSSCQLVLIALHACDTATDDAIFYGIQSNAEVIVVAPCCQKQVRKQIDEQFKILKSSVTSGTSISNHTDMIDFTSTWALTGLLESGIHRERLSEMVTDKIRALLLELAGYDTQVFEFIDGEHTTKNTMIAAIKRKKQKDNSYQTTVVTETKVKLINLLKLFGVNKHQLIDQFIDADNAHIFSSSNNDFLKASDLPFYSNTVSKQKAIPRIRRKLQ